MDYTTLVAAETTQGSIKYWINYSRIDSAGILSEAQAWIYQRLRVRQMVEMASVSIASGASTASLPSDYLDPIHLGIPGTINEIRLTDPQRFRGLLGFDSDGSLPSGTPTRWADYDDTINLNSEADQAYTAKLVYYAEPTALSGANETNWLTDRYPMLLRNVCTMFAADARKDWALMERKQVQAMELISQIKAESDLGMRGMELDFNWEGHP
ncbi:phage adaptor protein [Pseudohoeflea coraliihabitans]|uniref:Uncharacterized protein n=1 Tax=Pseudohoeflea coraliihabitans TaxID=2860393 RepID=A0ABS6WTG7_9HYPH|nr:hypothetical protein [Pseudohoeflea sp. DP4N28-3]MBW3099257.1 hypothetical protein [Pseudohoeflea sp. DP4N28-3]